ncbi:MAG: DNA recombination protein RmuC [Candidatus Poseidonia sp.]|nr:DNA recombination protein RmuC [Poseidonia sp.]
MAELVEMATLGALVLLMVLVYLRTKDANQSQALVQTSERVSDTYEKMQEEYKAMQGILNSVNLEIEKSTQGRQQVIDFSRDLRDIMMKPSLRGDVAEKLLEDMCKDFLPDSAWERQKVTDEEAASQQGGVDVLLKTGKLSVPVDSKFPREAWKRYVNLTEESMNGKNESEQKQHRNNIKREFEGFQKAVLTKVDEIQKHINPGSGTTDFALMFIPTEAMYYSVISDKNALNEENKITRKTKEQYLLDAMLSEGVIPVSPSTFYPFIHVILVGIKNMQVVENLETLQKRLNQFETKLRTFSGAYDEIGAKLQDATEAWTATGNRYNDLVRLGGSITKALEEVNVTESTSEASAQQEVPVLENSDEPSVV